MGPTWELLAPGWAHMGPTWDMSAPCGPHASPMNLVQGSYGDKCASITCNIMHAYHFMPERGITDAISSIYELQERFHMVNKTLYMGLVNLEKAFDQTPRLIIWWALGRLGFENWLLCPTQSMYEYARSRVLVATWVNLQFESKSLPGL